MTDKKNDQDRNYQRIYNKIICGKQRHRKLEVNQKFKAKQK